MRKPVKKWTEERVFMEAPAGLRGQGGAIIETYGVPALRQRVAESEFLKLKADFLEVLEICPTTNRRGEEPGCAAGAIRRLLGIKGWTYVIKTNDDIEELATHCDGLVVSAYAIGSRTGQSKLLVVRHEQKRSIGRTNYRAELRMLAHESARALQLSLWDQKEHGGSDVSVRPRGDHRRSDARGRWSASESFKGDRKNGSPCP